MAASLVPSVEKAYYLRVEALLVDGGTLVLRSLIENRYPGIQWDTFLNQQQSKHKVTNLRNKKVIRQEQYDLLYPQNSTTDTSKYDISLLVCVLRSLLYPHTPAYIWNVIPPSTDVTEQADIKRLSHERNKLAHSTSTVMTKQEFEAQWTYLEQVLVRLGRNIPDLKENIDRLREDSIDPEREKELKEIIKIWEDLDNALQEEIQEVKLKVQEHDQILRNMQRRSLKVKDQTEQIQLEAGNLATQVSKNADKIKNMEEDTTKLQNQLMSHDQKIQNVNAKQIEVGSSSKELAERVHETDAKVTKHICDSESRLGALEQTSKDTNVALINLSEKQASMEEDTKMSQELKNLASITKMFLDQDTLSDELYVHTQQHEEARKKLLSYNLVVLTGHPGEGKTTMSLKLMLEVTAVEKCLKLDEPSDWRLVDFTKFEVIFIDDIFGPGVLDETLVKSWDKYLPGIWQAVKNKKIKLIIATRHYILEEAQQTFNRSSLFKKEHLQFLSSNYLSIDERTLMLTRHLQHDGTDTDANITLINTCVAFSTSFLNSILTGEPSFLFGFPECVSIFVKNKDLRETGAEFFSSPYIFFRNCIEDLRKDEEKFLALLMIWCKPGKTLLQSDLELSSTSEDIKLVLRNFGFKLNGKLLKTLRMSLKHHTKGFLRYSKSSGAYKFSHNVISDMVGLVISEDYPEDCLDFADRDFVLEYVTIQESEGSEFCFFVEEHLQTRLMEAFIRLAKIPSADLSVIDELSLKRDGYRPNKIHSYSKMDVGIFFHDAFSDQQFTCKFVKHLSQTGKLDMISESPVMNMSGFFLSYGFKLQEMDIYLPSYTLFHCDGVLFLEMLDQDVLSTQENGEHLKNEMYLAMLISAHKNHVGVIKALLNKGVDISEEVIYVAAIDQNLEILELLLNNPGRRLTRCNFENNNNALMVATKKGLLDSVRLLARYTDLSLRNECNVSALDKAVIYKQEDVFKVLIESGAPLNEKSGKFKRTPLHTAADMGLDVFVDMLLKAGASTDIKDHRGHYPIHCAAIRENINIVSKLVLHNPSQVKKRIASYGKSSKIKGMTVFHIAVWKNNKDMMKALLNGSTDCNVQDWYGQSPLYCASFEGKKKLVKMLLPFSQTDQADKRGYTPLHAAIHRGHGTVVQLLLPQSNVNAQDKYGCTPLHVACRRGYVDVVEQLLELKADPHIITKRGKAVFQVLLHNERRIPLSSKELPPVNEPKKDFTASVHAIYSHSPSFLNMKMPK